MKKLLIFFPLLLVCLVVSNAQAAVVGKFVQYKAGKSTLVSYIAYDNAVKGKRPGVIIAPDWWGMNDFARNRANALANLGYTAIVMDNYGSLGIYAEPASQASALMNGFLENPETMFERFDAAHKVLARDKTVDKKRIAAIGYSLGGKVVLEIARSGRDLDAVASIWGVVSKPENTDKKGKVKANVLFLQPENDSWAPMDAVKAVEKEMKDSGVKTKVIVYPGTVHGFSRHNSSELARKYNLGIRYNAEADKKSWEDLIVFLKDSLK